MRVDDDIKLVISGHSHRALVRNIDGKRIDVVASPAVSYVIGFNQEKKEVEYIDVYEYQVGKAA